MGFDGEQLTIAESEAGRIDSTQLSQIGSAQLAPRLTTEPFDLRLDPGASERIVAPDPTNCHDSGTLAQSKVEQAAANPFVADESIDLVIIDCLANRLDVADARRIRAEAFRVLRRGGVVLDLCLLADEPMPDGHAVAEGPWMGMRFPLEAEGTSELEGAGFYGLTGDALVLRPVQIANGVEIRAFVTTGYKGKQGVCRDQGHAVIYRGPWSAVHDDDGHRYARGERTAVCAKTYDILMRAPYRGQFIGLLPYAPIPLADAPLFDCNTPALKNPGDHKRSAVGARWSVHSKLLSSKNESGSGATCC